MSIEHERASDVSPAPKPHRRRTDTLSGWTPAHDDDTPDATTWRARKGLEEATKANAAIGKLTASVEQLNATIRRALSVLKWVGTPVLAIFLADTTHSAYKALALYLSTFHH